jgi:hypothetical protein
MVFKIKKLFVSAPEDSTKLSKSPMVAVPQTFTRIAYK